MIGLPAIAVLGAQWGDESKGKIVHLLAKDADMVVRFNGGTNAGHTVIDRRGEFRFHLIPSGALHKDCTGVLGNGMVIDPRALADELSLLEKRCGFKPNVFISDRAHLVLPYHTKVEGLEGVKSEIGTTAKGIGPTYRDKASRSGIRVGNLLFPEIFKEKLSKNLEKERKIWGNSLGEFPNLADEILALAEVFKKRIIDTTKLINSALDEGKKVIFEGAQGCLLDIDFGTYPYVTSSNTTIGGIGTGAGVSPGRVDEVIGVVKAYTTRVGSGPFPTEEKGKEGEILLRKGNEYGTTTGRPRRCGWLDIVALRYAAKINGFTKLALTKLDVLSDFEEIKVAVRYKYKEKLMDEFPSQIAVLEECQPVYEKLPGWKGSIRDLKEFDDLPKRAKEYIYFIEEALGFPIFLVSVGPGVEAAIFT